MNTSSLAYLESLELSASIPYIDFHYNNDQSDFTARIAAENNETLNIVSSTGATLLVNGDRVVTCKDKEHGIEFTWKLISEYTSGLYVIVDGLLINTPLITHNGVSN